MASAPLFEGVHFAVIPNHDFDENKTIEDLKANGATHWSLNSGENELRQLTHLISSTTDFPAYHESIAAFIHVVKPSWVEYSISKGKAASVRPFSPDEALIFSDVVVAFTEEIPKGDKDAIIGGVMAMGGQYAPQMSRPVTHLITLTMNNKQCDLIKEKQLAVKPVLPHWFDDCLKLGKKINDAPYTLPDPTFTLQDSLNGGRLRPEAIPSSIEGASQLDPEEKPPTQIQVRTDLSVFRNRDILLCRDLRISDHLRDSLRLVIEAAGGNVVSSETKANTVICQFRGSADFINASKDAKDVGNLLWLYWLIRNNHWTDPTRRLLHYPIPTNGIPGFKPLRIAISNYAGEARVYFDNLIKAAGGVYTKTMSQDNTHLVTAHEYSEKVDAARNWGLHVVNHLWLEETYARGEIQSVTNPRYTTFPKRTNLTEVVGQTPIDRDVIKATYFPDIYTTDSQEPLQNDNSNAKLPKATPKSKGKPATKGVDPENQISHSGRSAKSRAIGALHSIASDILLYQKESKRVGGVIYGGRRVNDPDRVNLDRTPSTSKKRASVDGAEHVHEDSPAAKKSKISNPPERSISEISTRILVTGGQAFGFTDAKTAKLRKLGIKVLSDLPAGSGTVDIVVSNKVSRTIKFLGAIALGAGFVNPKWIDECIKQGEVLDTEGYELEDRKAENTEGFSLSNAVKEARLLRKKGGMLKGDTIYCTENIEGGFENFKKLINLNGGTCVLWKGRETKPQAAAPGSQLTLVSDAGQQGLWSKFKEMARAGGFQPRVMARDWVLKMFITQDRNVISEDWILDAGDASDDEA